MDHQTQIKYLKSGTKSKSVVSKLNQLHDNIP